MESGTGADSSAVESLYDRIGGSATFDRLVTAFYAGVASDPPLRALYPEADLGPAADRLRLFLEQYWGGPRQYSELRGHPRLRIRHAPFKIDAEQRDRWLRHMTAALDSLDLPPAERAEFGEYVSRAAHFMINSWE